MKYIQSYKLFESYALAKKYKDELYDKGLDFDTLVRVDTSPNHKYLPMICRYALDGVELDDIQNYIKAFDMLSSKNKITNKDIYSYKEFNALKDVVDVADLKSKGDLIGEIRKEREIVLDNEDFLVFIPLSHRSSVKYGMGSKWCISMKDDPFMWYAMTNSNIRFYFVIVKNKEISNKLFNKFKDKLDDSWIGAQGDVNDKTNFEKFVVMVYGKKLIKNTRMIWTKSNHALNMKYTKNFFKELGLNSDLFKNELPHKSINTDDLDESKKFENKEEHLGHSDQNYNKLYDAIFDFLETEGGYELENDYFTAPIAGMMDMLKVVGNKPYKLPSSAIKFWRFYKEYNLKKIRLQFLDSIEIFNFLVDKMKPYLYQDESFIYIENKNFSYSLKSKDIDKVIEIINNLKSEDFEDWKMAKKYNL